MKRYQILCVAILVPCLATACRRDVPQNHVTEYSEPAAAMPGAGPNASAGAPQADVVYGQVVETMDAGTQYTYVQIDTGTEKLWAAGPLSTVKVGDKLGFSKSLPMPNFKSEALGREFDVVYFVGGFQKPDGSPWAASGHGGAMGSGGMAAGGMGQSAQKHTTGPSGVNVEAIEKPEGGKTVAEIHAEKDEIAGKEVKLRGKVVKYNAQILGKNWLHVQDGSGDAAAGTHDLTITTSATAKVGDTVLVTGKLVVNKDFGAGYKYDLIIEDAQVVVE